MIDIHYKKTLQKFELDVTFKIPETGISILFGPSGSGKSSILSLMAGLDDEYEINHASFVLNKKTYDNTSQYIKLKPWQRKIAYVFQEHRLFPHMTIEKNILFGYQRRNSDLNINDLVEKFKIKTFLQNYPHQLSGGQKQRVALVRALLSKPDMLLLDEPLAALDYQSKIEIWPYIEGIHNELNIPIVYVSHDIKEVLTLADYIVVIDNGRVVDQGDIAELCIKQPLLTQAEGASFILNGQVVERLEGEQLVKVSCENESLLITDKDLQLNKKVRLLIHAKDVSLCLAPPKDSSILNCIAVCVESIDDLGNGKVRIIAKFGKQFIVALISHRSKRLLNIENNKHVFAQFKATAIIK